MPTDLPLDALELANLSWVHWVNESRVRPVLAATRLGRLSWQDGFYATLAL